MNHRLHVALIGAALFAGAAAAYTGSSVPGERLGSGLGEVDQYSKWAEPTGSNVAGAQPTSAAAGSVVADKKLDNGVDEPDQYSKWAEPTGPSMTGTRPVPLAADAIELASR